ncbi:MAG TPA: carboxypeptidase-like regulatory domain-containing protein [Vicinamibacteria bacterium]
MKHASLAPMSLLGGLALSCVASCASGDYIFGVAGQVRDAAGRPVLGARVTLATDRPVYDTITPIRSRAVETDAVGWFAFMYITRQLPTPYVLLVEKQGCTSQKVSGVAPPSQEHSITLDCRVGS